MREPIISLQLKEGVATPFALEIGEISLSWNDAHATIFRAFEAFSGMDQQRAAIIFYGIPSDSQRRHLTATLARHYKSNSNDIDLNNHIDDFCKLLETLEKKFSRIRNGTVHATFAINYQYEVVMNPYIPAQSNKHPSHFEYDGITPVKDILMKCKRHIDELSEELGELVNIFLLKCPLHEPSS